MNEWVKIGASFISGVVLTLGGRLLDKRAKRKVLVYEYSFGELARLDGTFKSDLEIFFQGEKVEDASTVTLIVKNAGSTPILPVDFEGDLRLCFPGSAAILQLRYSHPADRNPKLVLSSKPDEPAAIFIAPMLLNKGDEFTLFALVSGFKKEISLAGRVAGVSKITGKAHSQPEEAYNGATVGDFWDAMAPILLLMIAVKFIFFRGHLQGLSVAWTLATYLGVSFVVTYIVILIRFRWMGKAF